MAELRRDPLRGHYVILAPERSKRPSDFQRPPQIILRSEQNPFLPGNEGQTPPELDAVRRNDSPPNGPGWTVRVFDNKYSALKPEPDPVLTRGGGVGFFSATEAYGTQEVMVMTPDPERPIAAMQIDELDQVFALAQHRLALAARRERVNYALLFENRGPEAGASRHHPHLQLYAMEVVPPGIEDLRVRARRHWDSRESNLFGDVLAAELDQGERVIRADSSFVTVAPFGSRVPYELLLMPRAQSCTFITVPPAERRRFAAHLRDVMQRLDRTLGRPPYNLLLHTAFRHDPLERDSFRWHVEILPRLSIQSGMEWTVSMYMNVTAPEAAAVDLRA
ncbi:MAG: galactose-1-phosphate uridylyltransferase [Myxococcota bacterium]